jgi:hypothetical protein
MFTLIKLARKVGRVFRSIKRGQSEEKKWAKHTDALPPQDGG